MATRQRICRIRVLAKMAILENWPDSIHSPDIRQPFPRTRYIRSHSTFAIFEKNVTRLDTFARVIRHFGEFGASGHCLIKTQIFNFSMHYDEAAGRGEFLWTHTTASMGIAFQTTADKVQSFSLLT